MQTCLVCGNIYNNIKGTCPGFNRDRIPKDIYKRKRWLKLYRAHRCRGWVREKKIKPWKKQNTFLQPYDENGITKRWFFNSNKIPFSSSSNYVANVESNKTPISSTTTSCNAKDLTLIEKPKIKTDTAEICNTHFGLDRFMDTKLERLKPGANTISQPYDGKGIREEHIGNIPSTSSSSNCVANVESNKTPISSDRTSCNDPSLFLDKNITNTKKIQSASTILKNWRSTQNDANVERNNNLTIFLTSSKDVEFYCSVPECKTNTEKEFEHLCVYAPPMKRLKKWSDILGVPLTPTSLVCGRHFRLSDIQRVTKLSIKYFYRILDPDALPVPMNDVPVLNRCENTFTSLIDNEVDEQASEKKKNNVEDNTSMTIDLTIDDSSNSSLSITLEATT